MWLPIPDPHEPTPETVTAAPGMVALPEMGESRLGYEVYHEGLLARLYVRELDNWEYRLTLTFRQAQVLVASMNMEQERTASEELDKAIGEEGQ